MSDLINWGERILTLAVGGGLFKGADYLLQKKKADNDDFTLLKQSYREEFVRYEEKFDKLNALYAKLEDRLQRVVEENEQLKMKLQSMQDSYPDLPVPMWLKDPSGMMLSLNKAYEDAFLFPQHKTRMDYIGKYDEDIWGENIASIFRTNDIAAISKKTMSFVVEDSEDNHLLKGWEFFKYPKFADGVFIGVGGIALPRHEYNAN